MKRKKIALIGVCILIFAVLLIRGTSLKLHDDGGRRETEAGDRLTRGEAAKYLSLLYYSREELEALPVEDIYEDTGKEQWYDIYINGLYRIGLTGTEGEGDMDKFRPADYLKNGELNEYLKRMSAIYGIEKGSNDELYNMAGIQNGTAFEELDPSEYADKALFQDIYRVLTAKLCGQQMKTQKLLLFGTREQNPALEEWAVVTNQGTLYADGLDLASKLDQTVQAVTRENTIVFMEESQEEAELKNVWIPEGDKKQGAQKLTVYYGGIQKSMDVENPLAEPVSGVICDLTVRDGKIIKAGIKRDILNGKVLMTGNKDIAILTDEGEKKLPLDTDFKIYRLNGQIETETAKGILVGYSNTDFVIADNKICAALIRGEIKAENIRVLIKTDEFKELLHESVELTCDTPFTVSTGKERKKYKAGKKLVLKPDSKLLMNGTLTVRSDKDGGKITVLSIKRNGRNPKYRGGMDISNYEDKLVMVNELPIEEYLYGVVPSEMPDSYGVEALKVQAVCARSYAYNQLMSNGCGKYGAHVDDSVSYQVYNNMPENENTIQAVKDTWGQVLKYDSQVITAYYFSTSCGHTSSANAVWLSADGVPYLDGSWQTKAGTEPKKNKDLSDEQNFREFITRSPADTYDSSYAWFRWKVDISAENLKKAIDAGLKTRYQANPKLILTQNQKGGYSSEPIDTVGNVKDLTVSRRAEGGIATEVIVEGSEKTIKIISEYNIRTLLAPRYDSLVRQDESAVNNMSMLPSAFFVEDKKTSGKKTVFSFKGGGYGHGVGMSQNGAKAMADSGESYDEILKHYYKGIEIGYLY